MMLIVLLETRWSWPTPCSSLSTPPCRIESICASACPWRWSEWRNIETIQGGCSHWDALEQAIGSIWNLSCQQYSFHLHWSPWSFWVKLNSCISSYFFWRSFSRIFNDFGSKFEVIDATGEEPLTGMVAAITNVSQSQQWESYGLLLTFMYRILKVLSHVLMKLVMVLKMVILLPLLRWRVWMAWTTLLLARSRCLVCVMMYLCMLGFNMIYTYVGPYTFSIGDTSNLPEYKSGGIFSQVKMPKYIDFVSDTWMNSLTIHSLTLWFSSCPTRKHLSSLNSWFPTLPNSIDQCNFILLSKLFNNSWKRISDTLSLEMSRTLFKYWNLQRHLLALLKTNLNWMRSSSRNLHINQLVNCLLW